MYKQITGKEALGKVANEEQLFYRLSSSDNWTEVSPFAEWSISDFLESERYVFAIKTEAMRYECKRLIVQGVDVISVNVEKFAGKAVRITVEEIEQ